jgi:hypothetical protein
MSDVSFSLHRPRRSGQGQQAYDEHQMFFYILIVFMQATMARPETKRDFDGKRGELFFAKLE